MLTTLAVEVHLDCTLLESTILCIIFESETLSLLLGIFSQTSSNNSRLIIALKWSASHIFRQAAESQWLLPFAPVVMLTIATEYFMFC